MAQLISSPAQAKKNIRGYKAFVASNNDLIDRLSFHRAWYALPNGRGGWDLGSSKIIGYQNLTPEEYLVPGKDGRQTEAVLQKWFEEIDGRHPDHDQLFEALSELLGKYGKKPSKAARINVLRPDVEDPAANRDAAICDLIIEIARGLDKDQVYVLRKRLKGIGRT